MTLVATIVVLGVLIFVHELGHFWAAKAVGIRVERFSLGLGPRVVGFQRGETEYVISAVPLGGYVKMGGMDDEVMDRLEGGTEGSGGGGEKGEVGGEDGDRGVDGEGQAREAREARPAREPSPRDFDAKPLWARAFVISAGVIMNFVFAFIAYAAASGLWGLQVHDTDRLGEVVAEQLPEGAGELARIPAGSRLLRIGERPVEDWRDVRAGLREGEAGPVVVEAAPAGSEAGEVVRVSIEVPADEGTRLRLYRALVPWLPAEVGAVNPGSPADRGGLEGGDRIVAVDGTEVAGWSDFVREIQARPGERTELRVERDGREVVRVVTPEAVEQRDPESGERTTVGQVGIYPSGGGTVRVRVGPMEAVRAGAAETVAVTWLIVEFLGDLFTGDVSPRSVGSVFTIGEASGQAVRAGMDTFLRFMAFFSVNLAILNLLPIPVLDGGHLLFLGIEAVRGRALSIEQRVRWSQVGFLIIVALMVWALSNDVLRLLGL